MRIARTPTQACSDINDAFSNLFHECNGNIQTKVCLTCNRHVYPDKFCWLSRTILIKRKRLLYHIKGVPDNLSKDYQYRGAGYQPPMKNMVLAPRGCFNTNTNSFLVCTDCYKDLFSNQQRPYFSLANNFAFGEAPEALKCLNDVELALVAQSRISGHIFTFHGGKHQCMTGMHSLYDVSLAHVAGSLDHMEQLGFPAVIACVLSGPFTSFQKQFVLRKMTINRHKVKAAFAWLRSNNVFYENITDQEIDGIPEPIFIDRSSECPSENNNVEMTESFDFVFPDATCTEANAGMDTLEQNRQVILELKKKGHAFTLASYSTKNILRDFESHSFEKAFPLQFPYGIGGRNDEHFKKDKPEKCDVNDYIEYLINVANPTFQTPTFLLVLCNVFFRQRILQRSAWQVKAKNVNDVFVNNVATLNPNKLLQAVENVINGVHNISSTSADLISSLKTVCRALPHTNEAARDARSKIYSMSLRFGQPAIFFTISPDDLNNLRIQIYGGNEWDAVPTVDEINNLTESELKERFKKRTEFRIAYPGYCCYDFEIILEIIERRLLGWDSKNVCAYEDGGVFGMVDAFVAAVEEQGRKTLHAHYAIYLTEWNNVLEELFNANEDLRESIENEIAAYFDSIGSTAMLGNRIRHVCEGIEASQNRNVSDYVLVSEEKLRDLRHNEGCRIRKGIFAQCDNCDEKFNCEDLASYVVNQNSNLPFDMDLNKPSVDKMEILKMQMMVPLFNINHNAQIVNALNNLHASYHRKACFKRDCECRHHFPQLPNSKTFLNAYTQAEWYDWSGVKGTRDIYELKIKRQKFDLYTNVYSPIISNSCLACNSNISLIFNGRVPIYMTNYISKGTQEDDSESYRRLINNVKRRFTYQIHEIDFSESLSRLLSCVFAHTRAHVMSAPMAKYLIRNKSRFRFSHNFEFVPIETVSRIINDAPFLLQIRQQGRRAFFTSRALDYLYRPDQLEQISMYEFFSSYESVNNNRKNANSTLLVFKKEHPEHETRAMRKHDRNLVLNLSPWKWPNSKAFGGNIFRTRMLQGKQMEAIDRFAKFSLLLFLPFRNTDHLKHRGSFVKRLEKAVNNHELSDNWKTVLSHIQNVKNNCAVEPPKDALEGITSQFEKQRNDNGRIENNEELFDELDDELDELHELSQDMVYDDMDAFQRHILDEENISLASLCNQGSNKSGLEFVANVTLNEAEHGPFIRYSQHGNSNTSNPNGTPNTTQQSGRYFSDAQTLLKVSASRKRRCVQTEDDERKAFPIANGSVTSMLDWSKVAKLDSKQEEGFLSLVSTFVLTYYDDARNADTTDTTGDRRIRRTRHDMNKQIKFLKQVNGRDQLVLFLTGAAGAGKSKVINEVLSYCKEYCEQIMVPFTDRTIVVTALTGVAAVLINGETLHSAAHVYNKIITAEMIERWQDARLLIIDEISFATQDLIEQVDGRLKELKEKPHEPFGGISVAFLGDFRQLEPVQHEPIYRDTCHPIWYNYVNCFIELETNHRAKHDPEFASILKRFRDGAPTQTDIDKINSRVVTNETIVPNNIQYACPTNKERCAINNAIFLKHLKNTHSQNQNEESPLHTLMIGADKLMLSKQRGRGGKPFYCSKLLFEECSEANCKKSNNSRIDPLLKLYLGCVIMLIQNTDVREGEANGCSCVVKTIELKPNVEIQRRCVNGFWVNYVNADDVAIIKVVPESDSTKTFILMPEKHSGVRVHFPKPASLATDDDKRMYITMKMNQFSMNINHATTGHKLQGKSLDQLFISSWSYQRNWPYVLLSRARTLNGLFLRHKLKPAFGKDSKDYTVPRELIKMMNRFETTKRPTVFDIFDADDVRDAEETMHRRANP
jgi:hypothetical protein